MNTLRQVAALVVVPCALAIVMAQDAAKQRSAIIFVAGALRHGQINPTDTPALHRIRTEGVHFANSHSVFPSQTMPNAAAIATGHAPGDTGQFANQLFVGYPLFDTGNFGLGRGTMVPLVEDAAVLADINDHFGGNYLREASLVAYARSYGYHTAVIGRTGPAALQDVSELSPRRGALRDPATIIIDGATGTPRGAPVIPSTLALIKAAGLAPVPPPRDRSDVDRQQWFADVVTKALLPAFGKSPEPFVLLFWSGDPDRAQHARGDDRSLKQILDYLDAHPEVRNNTNIFVTAAHGISAISHREVDASGRATSSYSATLRYRDAPGRQEVPDGSLPPGFLAIDLARALDLPLYDPETQTLDEAGRASYGKVDPSLEQQSSAVRQRPAGSAALIGGTGRIAKPTDAKVVVAQTSIYVPDNDAGVIERIVRFLATQDYVGGIFVNDRFGEMRGALPMSDVGLLGRATMPKPAVMVNLKSYLRDPGDPLMTGVSVGASRLEGQGGDGSLARANTFNNMAAMGPDFKKRYVNHAPVGNADVQPTLAHAMRMKIPSFGRLRGRVMSEALAGGPQTQRFSRHVVRSRPSAGGEATVLMYQRVGNHRYLDEACFTRAQTCEVR